MLILMTIVRNISYIYSKHRTTLLVRIYRGGKYVWEYRTGKGNNKMVAIKSTTISNTYHEPGTCTIIIINGIIMPVHYLT